MKTWLRVMALVTPLLYLVHTLVLDPWVGFSASGTFDDFGDNARFRLGFDLDDAFRNGSGKEQFWYVSGVVLLYLSFVLVVLAVISLATSRDQATITFVPVDDELPPPPPPL